MRFLKNELSIPPNLPLTEPSGKKKYYNLTNINQRIPRLNRLLKKSNTDINLYNKQQKSIKKASINQNINRFGSAT